LLIRAPSGSSTTALALAAGSVTIELKQIPNQPIIFVVFSQLNLFNISKILMFVLFLPTKKGGSIANIPI
jgi:hypothetical protein